MIHFVYRPHYEGPLSERVRRLPDASVLDWFRRGWTATVDGGPDPQAWTEAELGGNVYGLATIFEAARGGGIPAPESWQVLRDVLDQHLYFEGELLVDADSVRVLTDDDELALAYFFFADTLG